MKITSIEGYSLSSSFGSGNELGHSQGKKSIGLVEIHTDEGVSGIGETYAGVYVPELVEPITNMLKASLIGEELKDKPLPMPLIPQVGQNGLLRSIWSAFDIAMWDVLSKAARKPLHKFINPLHQNSEPAVYYSGGLAAWTPDQVKADIEKAKNQDHYAYKMRIGKSEWTKDLARVCVAKELMGDQDFLMVDAIQGTLSPPWTVSEAIQRAIDLEEFNITWLEEPLDPTNILGYHALINSTTVDLALGESFTNCFEYDSYSHLEGIKWVQIDVTHCGGISAALDIVKDRNYNIALHNWGSEIGYAANNHFGTVCEDVVWIEYPSVPLRLNQLIEGKGNVLFGPGIGRKLLSFAKSTCPIVQGSGYKI